MGDIRQLETCDWRALRDIRLEALENHPDVLFSPEDEASFSPSRWIAMLASPDRAYFAAYHDGVLSGIGAVTTFIDTAEERTAQLTGFYIRDAAQHNAIAKPLFKACMRWMLAQDFSGVTVAVRDENKSVMAACRFAGFREYEADQATYADGSTGLRHKFFMAVKGGARRDAYPAALEPERPFPMILGL